MLLCYHLKKIWDMVEGHNIAINMVDSDYHVVINPDIKFQNDVLRKMYDYMEEHKDVVLLSPKILNSDGSEQFCLKGILVLSMF